MKYVRLGRTNLRVSPLCLGAMGIGDKAWRGWVLEKDEARPIVSRALDAGINFFDTCDFYSAGRSEEILGELLRGAVPRDELVIATKAGSRMRPDANGRGYSRKHLSAALDASLKRLGVDHVDLFQTHVWDPDTDLEELVDAFDELVRAGKTLYAGAASMPAWTFSAALHLARRKGVHRFVSMQCEYNPCHREAERELMPLCRAEGVGLIPFSPMARGFLSADRRREDKSTVRTETDDYLRKYYFRDGDFQTYDAVADVAGRYGASPSQVAICWTASRPGIVAPVFGATRPEHVDAAVAALSIELAEDDAKLIAGAYCTRPLDSGGH